MINFVIDLLDQSPILSQLIYERKQMNKNKYKNVSLTHETYSILEKLSKALLPDAKLSISKTVECIANEKAKKLNGNLKEK